jgi:hypothetical protein
MGLTPNAPTPHLVLALYLQDLFGQAEKDGFSATG